MPSIHPSRHPDIRKIMAANLCMLNNHKMERGHDLAEEGSRKMRCRSQIVFRCVSQRIGRSSRYRSEAAKGEEAAFSSCIRSGVWVMNEAGEAVVSSNNRPGCHEGGKPKRRSALVVVRPSWWSWGCRRGCFLSCSRPGRSRRDWERPFLPGPCCGWHWRLG